MDRGAIAAPSRYAGAILSRSRYVVWIQQCVPAILLLPVVLSPFPNTVGTTFREIGFYFTAPAFARLGLEGFTVLTPDQSPASIKLYGILAAPFTLAGMPHWSRFLMFGAALGAGYLAYRLAAGTIDGKWALVVPGLLWVQPLYQRFATRFITEAFSIFFTVAAVYATYRAVASTERSRLWYALGLVALVLGMANHMWEGTIALVMVALYVHAREYERAGGVVATTVVAAVGIYLLTQLQPAFAASNTSRWSLLSDPDVFFSAEFVGRWLFYKLGTLAHPYELAFSAMLPLALVVLGWYAYRAYGEYERGDLSTETVMLASWVLGAMAIPILFAPIFPARGYYRWPFVVPLALAGTRLLATLDARVSVDSSTAIAVVLALLVLTGGVYALVFENGVMAGSGVPLAGDVSAGNEATIEGIDPGEAVEAGRELNRMGLLNASRVVFVGDWEQDADVQLYGSRPAAMRVMAYSTIPITKRHPWDEVGQGPRFVWNTTGVDDCAAMVVRTEREIEVRRCG